MYTYIIKQDGVLKAQFENQEDDFKVFGFMLRNQSFSLDYALKYGGWTIEVIDQNTGQKIPYMESAVKQISAKDGFPESNARVLGDIIITAKN